MSHNDLLNPTEVLFLSIYNQAVIIDREYSQFLEPPIEGIYKIGEIYPTIQLGHNYYEQNQTKAGITTVLIKDFNTVTGNVLDEAGNLLLTSNMMRNKLNYLKNSPTVPSRALMIVHYLIQNYIDIRCAHSRRSSAANQVLRNILPQHQDIFYDNHLENICSSLLEQVIQFIKNDTWFIYFVKFTGLDLVVQKTCDYRVYEWTMAQERANEDKQDMFERNSCV